MQMPTAPLLMDQVKITQNPFKRENNTILKPIFTKFKKLLKKHKQLKHFFDHRAYKENKVSLVDFEKLFSFVEIKGLWDELQNTLNREKATLCMPKLNYNDIRKEAYLEYSNRIFETLNTNMDYVERMNHLYANRKHKSQLDQIEQFRIELLRAKEESTQ